MPRRIRKTRTSSDPFLHYVTEFRASPTAYAQAARAARLICRDRGESAALLVEIPSKSDFLSPEG